MSAAGASTLQQRFTHILRSMSSQDPAHSDVAGMDNARLSGAAHAAANALAPVTQASAAGCHHACASPAVGEIRRQHHPSSAAAPPPHDPPAVVQHAPRPRAPSPPYGGAGWGVAPGAENPAHAAASNSGAAACSRSAPAPQFPPPAPATAEARATAATVAAASTAAHAVPDREPWRPGVTPTAKEELHIPAAGDRPAGASSEVAAGAGPTHEGAPSQGGECSVAAPAAEGGGRPPPQPPGAPVQPQPQPQPTVLRVYQRRPMVTVGVVAALVVGGVLLFLLVRFIKRRAAAAIVRAQARAKGAAPSADHIGRAGRAPPAPRRCEKRGGVAEGASGAAHARSGPHGKRAAPHLDDTAYAAVDGEADGAYNGKSACYMPYAFPGRGQLPLVAPVGAAHAAPVFSDVLPVEGRDGGRGARAPGATAAAMSMDPAFAADAAYIMRAPAAGARQRARICATQPGAAMSADPADVFHTTLLQWDDDLDYQDLLDDGDAYDQIKDFGGSRGVGKNCGNSDGDDGGSPEDDITQMGAVAASAPALAYARYVPDARPQPQPQPQHQLQPPVIRDPRVFEPVVRNAPARAAPASPRQGTGGILEMPIRPPVEAEPTSARDEYDDIAAYALERGHVTTLPAQAMFRLPPRRPVINTGDAAADARAPAKTHAPPLPASSGAPAAPSAVAPQGFSVTSIPLPVPRSALAQPQPQAENARGAGGGRAAAPHGYQQQVSPPAPAPTHAPVSSPVYASAGNVPPTALTHVASPQWAQSRAVGAHTATQPTPAPAVHSAASHAARETGPAASHASSSQSSGHADHRATVRAVGGHVGQSEPRTPRGRDQCASHLAPAAPPAGHSPSSSSASTAAAAPLVRSGAGHSGAADACSVAATASLGVSTAAAQS
jgi:hypothetical protein